MQVQVLRMASRIDPRMKELYLRVAASKAVVRVANKMAVVIWHILTERRPYEQVKERLYRSNLKKMKRIAS